MLSDRKAARLARRSARDTGSGLGSRVRGERAYRAYRAYRAWRTLTTQAERDDPAALAVVCRIARDRDHPWCPIARSLIAARWVDTRRPDLRAVIVETGTLSGDSRSYEILAALHGRLHQAPEMPLRGFDPGLLTDPDEAVRREANRVCAEATGARLDDLWQIAVPEHAPPRPGWWRSPMTRALLANPAPLPNHVVDAAWGSWLDEPDEALWEMLSAAGRPVRQTDPLAPCARARSWDCDVRDLSVLAMDINPALLRDPGLQISLLPAAAREGHPIAGLAREKILLANDPELYDLTAAVALEEWPQLLPFCVEHRLAPADPPLRAAFYLLTDQHDQYRAVDPDGSLLAVAYTGSSADVRSRIRDAMVRAGDLDPVRVLTAGANPGDLPTRMSGEERRFLTRQLAAREDWEGLWRLVLDLPVIDAVAAVTLFDDLWRPADDAGRLLFDRLAGVQSDKVATTGGSLVNAGGPADFLPLVDTNKLHTLTRRPMARMRPGDLATVTAIDGLANAPRTQELVALLRACLEYRFGAEVRVDPAEPAAGPYDIGLSGEDDDAG